MKNLYICITPFFPSPGNWRGAYVYDQMKAIVRNSNYQIIVFKPKSINSKVLDYEYEGIKVYYFKTLNLPSYILHGIFNNLNAHSFMNRVRELGIDINNISVAHGHTSQFASYALALKEANSTIRTVVQHHDCDPYTIRNGKLARLRWNALFRAKKNVNLIEKVDLNLCISESVKDFLTTFPNRPPHLYYEDYQHALNCVMGMKKPHIKDTYVLYNGVDTKLFNKDKSLLYQIEGEKKPKFFRIGCIANFQELKDHMTIVRAFRILVKEGHADIRLSLLGTGETKSKIEEYLITNDLYEMVEWPLEISHDNLSEYYNSLNLFVLPSYFEGFGCVCTEAAACGVPFMICKHQGAAEYISPEELDLWTFEPHDYKTLAKLIKDYKHNPRPQKLIHSYDINELIGNYLKYLQQLA